MHGAQLIESMEVQHGLPQVRYIEFTGIDFKVKIQGTPANGQETRSVHQIFVQSAFFYQTASFPSLRRQMKVKIRSKNLFQV